MRKRLSAIAAIGLGGAAAPSASVTVPFDFSKGEVAFEAQISGKALYGLLDTGVDPSAIDLGTAEHLHLQVQRRGAGEASGEGGGRSAPAYPSRIVGLSISGRRYPPVAAIASDMRGMSEDYGRPLHFILGYSFLKHQPVLIDYVEDRLSFIERAADAAPLVSMCRTHFEQPLRLLKGLNWPVISGFRFGGAAAPVSLDTGLNSGVALYQAALSLGDVQARLRAAGTVSHGGFRGDATISAYRLDETIGFGPFDLPAGQAVTVRKDAGSPETRVANVGNPVLAAMKLKMLLDYPAGRIDFWGDCS